MLRKVTLAAGLAAAVSALGLAGCSGTSTGTGPPPSSDPVEATVVGVVLPFGGFSEVEVWQDAALKQEARTHAVIRLYRLGPDDPPDREADLVRKAAAEGCSALIVLAQDPKAVGPAVTEARNGGTPVVILDNPVPSEGTSPATLVAYEDESAVARKLVDAAIADAKETGFPADGPALLVYSKSADVHTQNRLKGLRDALKAAGVRMLPDTTYTGPKSAVVSALTVAHEIAPHLAMVFAIDDEGVRGVNEFRHLLDHKKRRFILAGYAVSPDLMMLAGGVTGGNVAAAMVDRRVVEPMKVAIDAALALARGETVPTEIRVPTPMARRTGSEVENFFPVYMGRPDMFKQEGDAPKPSAGPEKSPKAP